LDCRKVIAISSTSTVSKLLTLICRRIKGKSQKDTSAITSFNGMLTNVITQLTGNSCGARTFGLTTLSTFGHGGKVVSVAATPAILELPTFTGMPIESVAHERAGAVSNINIGLANFINTYWCGRRYGLLMTSSHALFMVSKVISIAEAASICEDITSSHIMIPIPANELSSTSAFVFGMQTTVRRKFGS
jgi:hypothetical protein